MANSSSSPRRPINPDALLPYVTQLKLAQPIEDSGKRSLTIRREQLTPVIRADIGSMVPVKAHLYRLYVPIAQVDWESPTAFRRWTIATDEDIDTLRDLLIRDFGGVTTLRQTPSSLQGSGFRDPLDPSTIELNEHAAFEVLASATHQSDVYFSALRRELEEALGEGVILIQRLEMTLIGSQVPAK